MNKRLFDPRDHAVNLILPRGKAMWASLKTAKGFKGDTEKEHHLCDVIVTEEEAQPIMDQCRGVQEKILALCGEEDKRMALANSRPWKTHDDDPDNIPAGYVQLKTKKRAFRANGNKPATPPIPTYVDGKKIDWDTADYNVGNGSLIEIAAAITPYYVPGPVGLGVTLQLKAVKVLELKKYVAGESGDKFYEDVFADGAETKKNEAESNDSEDNYFD
tara:strand:+ start:2407 stop:3057 length:651 start_codon:yes stop_codon:yes gene_type:complete